MIGMMPPPNINSFIDQKRFSNVPLINGHPQVNHSYRFQPSQIPLKDFITTSSNLLEPKRNRIRSKKEWILKTKPFLSKNMTFHGSRVNPYFKQGEVLNKIYKKPQSAKRPAFAANSLKAYQNRLVPQPAIGSRNLPKSVNAQNSNPITNKKYYFLITLQVRYTKAIER